MRIGIDASTWWNRRGYGRFTRELLSAMFAAPGGHEFCLFIDQEPAPEMIRSNVRVVQVDNSKMVTESAIAADSRPIRDIWAFRRAVSREPLDIMFFPGVYSWFPVKRGLPSIVTVHDAIAEHFPDLVFPSLRGRLFWGLKLRLAYWQADRIMTVSQAARDEIVAFHGTDIDQIDVISEAASSRFRPLADKNECAASRLRANLPPDQRLILCVGGIAPHKNLFNLLTGFGKAVMLKQIDDVDLVFVGDPEGAGFHSNYEELLAALEAEPHLRGRVHFTGYVSDDDLVALYSDALATAMPAFSEGFGLPAVESMACGTPVLCSDVGAVPEVVGDAGLLFDPNSPDAIAAAIHRIACDPGLLSSLSKNSLKRAGLYSWQRAAEAALGFLEATRAKRI